MTRCCHLCCLCCTQLASLPVFGLFNFNCQALLGSEDAAQLTLSQRLFSSSEITPSGVFQPTHPIAVFWEVFSTCLRWAARFVYRVKVPVKPCCPSVGASRVSVQPSVRLFLSSVTRHAALTRVGLSAFRLRPCRVCAVHQFAVCIQDMALPSNVSGCVAVVARLWSRSGDAHPVHGHGHDLSNLLLGRHGHGRRLVRRGHRPDSRVWPGHADDAESGRHRRRRLAHP